jgi:hypothetical protein
MILSLILTAPYVIVLPECKRGPTPSIGSTPEPPVPYDFSAQEDLGPRFALALAELEGGGCRNRLPGLGESCPDGTADGRQRGLSRRHVRTSLEPASCALVAGRKCLAGAPGRAVSLLCGQQTALGAPAHETWQHGSAAATRTVLPDSPSS